LENRANESQKDLSISRGTPTGVSLGSSFDDALEFRDDNHGLVCFPGTGSCLLGFRVGLDICKPPEAMTFIIKTPMI